MSDMTLDGTYVMICDWHGRIVWMSNAEEKVKPGELAWENLVEEDREHSRMAVARVVTLRESTSLEVRNLEGETYRVWLWPLHSPELAVCILAVSVPPELGSLTPREREILELLAEGCTTRDMAARLDVSLSTIHTHLRRCRQKLGLDSSESLTGFAARYCHRTEAPSAVPRNAVTSNQ